ncbi:hypothetical protein [Actinocatenispora rupis]|uniref:Uncharacterized protein n=1 Tax=Actinocatenispora rupis TaxID=519421 RepID=A0A8J3J1J8_9ACTN|nr:hypothetical protein [Actinocatenispora rupis]GID14081.1 hypothetical protein Aru02nite_49700 [Actinocatenispora rupis]
MKRVMAGKEYSGNTVHIADSSGLRALCGTKLAWSSDEFLSADSVSCSTCRKKARK